MFVGIKLGQRDGDHCTHKEDHYASLEIGPINNHQIDTASIGEGGRILVDYSYRDMQTKTAVGRTWLLSKTIFFTRELVIAIVIV